MILTEVSPAELPPLLGRFAQALLDRRARVVFARIACSDPTRAAGAKAEAGRLGAARLAGALGIRVAAGSPARGFGWDGLRLSAGTEAYVLLHEVAHFQLAGKRRRRAREFGLGPGPETGHRAAAERATLLSGAAREREEAMASLLGILWEVELGQPALASFLDQNWLEGAGRRGTAAHFEGVLAALRRHGAVDPAGRPRPVTAPPPLRRRPAFR